MPGPIRGIRIRATDWFQRKRANQTAHGLHLSFIGHDKSRRPCGSGGAHRYSPEWPLACRTWRVEGKIPRVAMTAADIPLTTGQAGQGGEGVRFMGVTAYDALIAWDLSRADVAATLRPGLALNWSVDVNRELAWTFRPRDGVTFHDGSRFTADAVVWNLDKLMRHDARRARPQSACAVTHDGRATLWQGGELGRPVPERAVLH